LTKGLNCVLLCIEKVKSGKKWEEVMVTECLENKTNSGKLFRFLLENRFGNLELRLLLFWARHPHAKLSIYTIASAMDTARINLRDAINALVSKCVLEENENGCGLTTYYLSNESGTQERIKELSCLDWAQLKILEKQLQGEALFY
jgi:hypothetical protein